MSSPSRGGRRALMAVALSVVLPAGCGTVVGPAGSAVLDRSFGGDGRVTTSFSETDSGTAVALQPDRRIVAVGAVEGIPAGFGLARYLPDGRLDTTFGGDGKVTTVIGDSPWTSDVSVQDDGKIIVVGSTFRRMDNVFVIARYLADGRLDPAFGRDGTVVTRFPGHSSAAAVGLQPNGRIVVAGGHGRAGAGEGGFAVARYRPDGRLDTSFGGDGKVTTRFGGGGTAEAMAIQADGTIVVAGMANRAASRFALARYLPDGRLDATFGGHGKVTSTFANPSHASDLAIQADGRLVVVGRVAGDNEKEADGALARYTRTGSLDASFGGDGKVTTSFSRSSDEFRAVVLQANGKIIAVGSASYYGEKIGLARYRTDGTLDPTFDGDGKATTSIKDESQGNDAIVQQDGRILVAGQAMSRIGRWYFALTRYRAP